MQCPTPCVCVEGCVLLENRKASARVMTVTVITDASLCHQTGAAGWGVWAKSTRGRINEGGAFRETMRNSNDAEVCAAVNGLAAAIKAGVAAEGDLILFQIDNLHAGAKVRSYRATRHKSLTVIERRALAEIRKLAETHALTIFVKHVKGHRSSLGGRHGAHGSADKISRKHMRMKREQLGPTAQVGATA